VAEDPPRTRDPRINLLVQFHLTSSLSRLRWRICALPNVFAVRQSLPASNIVQRTENIVAQFDYAITVCLEHIQLADWWGGGDQLICLLECCVMLKIMFTTTFLKVVFLRGNFLRMNVDTVDTYQFMSIWMKSMKTSSEIEGLNSIYQKPINFNNSGFSQKIFVINVLLLPQTQNEWEYKICFHNREQLI